MSATMGSDRAPQSWMASRKSDRRNRAFPARQRSSERNASPMKASQSQTPIHRRIAASPTRARTGSTFGLRRPDLAGTAVASARSRLTPSGNPSRSTSTPSRVHRDNTATRNVSWPLSQPARTPVSKITLLGRGDRSISWMTSLGAGTPRASFHSPPSATRSVPSGPRAHASWTTWFIAADPQFTSLRPLRKVDVDLDTAILRPAFLGCVARDRSRGAHADHQHLARVDAAAGQEVPDGFGAPQRKLLVVGDGSLRVAVALDPDAVLGVPGQDVAELRKLFHGGRLQDRAVVAEEQRRPQVDQDAVFGAPRVGDLPELLLLLVQVIADGTSGDTSHDRADGGAFPPARDCADPGAHRRSGACPDRGVLARSGASPKNDQSQHDEQEIAHPNLLRSQLSAQATASFSAPLFRISTPLPSSKTISARLQGPIAIWVSGWTSNAREMSRWAASQFPDPQTRSSSFGIMGTATVKPCAQTTITPTAALNSTRPQRMSGTSAPALLNSSSTCRPASRTISGSFLATHPPPHRLKPERR